MECRDIIHVSKPINLGQYVDDDDNINLDNRLMMLQLRMKTLST